MRSLLILVLLLLPTASWAQPPAAGAQPRPASPALTPAQAQQALEVLQDPAKREQFIAVLQALARSSPAANQAPVPAPTSAPTSAAAAAAAAAPAPAPPPTPAAAPAPAPAPAGPAISLEPNSLGAQILVDASQRLSHLSGEVVHTARRVTDFPLIWRFLKQSADDPWAQQMALATLWRLAVVMAAGLAAQWAAKRLLERPVRSLEGHARREEVDEEAEPAPEDRGLAEAEAGQTERLWRRLPSAIGLVRRLPLALARLLLNLLPVLALLAAGYAVLAAGLGQETIPRLVTLAVLHAYALCRVLTSLSRMLVGPGEPRLVPVPDHSAQYILRWVRRLAAVAVFGYTLAEVGLLFGLYTVAHDALIKLVMLVVHVMLAIIVLQNRRLLAGFIRARPEATGPVAVLRNRFAPVWHIVALFYLVAMWVVWALDIKNGFQLMVRFFLITVGVLFVARLLTSMLLGAVERATTVSPPLAERYPGLERRVGAYNPFIRGGVKCVITLVVLVVLLQSWGLDSFTWFEDGALGGRVVSALATMVVTLALALAVWEAVNFMIDRHLDRLSREAQIGRSARLRTLLPMFRTTLLISVCLVAGLMILSEVGVNIAPLLAGAGVVGLAIGFGSQRLVQDIITGLFLLLENTMQVGDAVTLGGLSGSVEALSVRTIRLRALDGAVHIVPFSAVTTVTNSTRDFAYAVLDVEVGLNEEPDHISDLLRELAREMRGEPRWESAIRDDLEVMGVDKFIDNAWVLRARIRTVPSQRWPVTRELNRRIKYRFDELAIESPITSHRALQLHVPADQPAEEVKS